MADDDLTFDLSVPDDTKVADDKGKSGPTQEAFDTLKKQLEEATAGRDQANQRAQQAENERRAAMSDQERAAAEKRSANLTMVTNAIESVKRETEILEANYAAALQGQDFTAAAKIQTSISSNAARLVQLETGKQAMEDEAKEAETRAKTQPRQSSPGADPVEALASQLSPRSAAWIRAHPEYARDQRLLQKMVGAHNVVTADGVAADTDDYFNKVESILGINKQDDGGSALSDASRATAGRQSAPAAAPVSRSGRGDGQRPNTITLTQQEREIAEMNGMTAREYAEQKMKLIKEGRMN